MIKLFRITTIPMSLEKLIAGQMQFMSKNGFSVTMVASDFNRKEEIERNENSRFVPINMTRTISPFKDLKSLFLMYKFLKKEKPQIIHSHTPKAGLISMLAGYLAGVPIRLHTVAGLPLMEAKGIKRFVLNTVEKLTYGCATKVYPNSNNLKDFIIDAGFCSVNKLKVIGTGSSNGINTEDFDRSPSVLEKSKGLLEQLGFSEHDFIFIFIGRLVRDKGIEELIEAFTKLSVDKPNLKLLLIGPEEPELDPLSNMAKQIINSSTNIKALGYLDEIRPYLAISHALVFPSYREGFPNVPMQAGAMGIPSIVSNINGCNEIIINGENGLIVPVKDSKSLEAAMEKLYLDKALYNKLKSNSRPYIVERFEQKVMWKLILEEYINHLKGA